jgi:type IV pilus assembly protein PilN
MARINLMPWRDALRAERQQNFVIAAVAAVIAGGLIVLALHQVWSSNIAFQESRNAYIQEQIEILNGKIAEIDALNATRDRLIARMQIIEQLQASRPQSVHLFDELVRRLPEGVYLTDIKQTGAEIELQGLAQSGARVSAFMRNIEASEWLSRPDLVVIEATDTPRGRASEFTLKVQLVTPGGDAEGEEEEGSA